MNNYNKFKELRKKYDKFIYEKYEIIEKATKSRTIKKQNK